MPLNTPFINHVAKPPFTSKARFKRRILMRRIKY